MLVGVNAPYLRKTCLTSSFCSNSSALLCRITEHAACLCLPVFASNEKWMVYKCHVCTNSQVC